VVGMLVVGWLITLRKVLKTLANQFLTMKELKEALPEIPENSLKRYLYEHKEYLNFKKEHNRFLIHVSEIEKLKLIRQYYSEGLKKEEVNAKLDESGFPVTITIDRDENTSLFSINDELMDMKKLVSFLVQQNEQSRMHQSKIKEQNKELLEEMYEMRNTLEEMREVLQTDYKKETKKINFLNESLLATQKTVEEVVSSMETEKSRGFWRKLFGK
jgi:hypothetical protein